MSQVPGLPQNGAVTFSKDLGNLQGLSPIDKIMCLAFLAPHSESHHLPISSFVRSFRVFTVAASPQTSSSPLKIKGLPPLAAVSLPARKWGSDGPRGDVHLAKMGHFLLWHFLDSEISVNTSEPLLPEGSRSTIFFGGLHLCLDEILQRIIRGGCN